MKIQSKYRIIEHDEDHTYLKDLKNNMIVFVIKNEKLKINQEIKAELESKDTHNFEWRINKYQITK